MSLRQSLYILFAALSTQVASPATISGKVSQRSDGFALGGAAVGIPAIRMGTATDEDGRFRLSHIPPGTHLVIASALGFASDTVSVTLAEADTLILQFALPTAPISLPGIIVRKKRVDEAERSSSFVTRLLPKESVRKVIDLPELLAQSVGIRVNSQGGYGSYSTVSIRGSTAEAVRVYLDGIPLNQALGGAVNLAAIPLSSVESINIYRGVIPPKFGGSGLGGVLDIRTYQADSATHSRLDISAGTFGTRLANLSLAGSLGPVRGLVALDGSVSDSDFPYLDDNGTRFTLDDDRWRRRRNNSFRRMAILARLASASQTAMSWSLSYHGQNSRKNLPGNSTFETPSFANVKSSQHLTEGQIRYQLPWLTTLEAQGYYSFLFDRFSDPLGQSGATGSQATHDHTRAVGGRLSATTLLLPAQTLSLFMGWQNESFAPDDTLLTNAAVRTTLLKPSGRMTFSLYGSDELRFFDGRVTLTGQIGLQKVVNNLVQEATTWKATIMDTTRTSTIPRSVGLVARFSPRLALKANWGRYHRIPSFYELFGDRGQTRGNGLLTPETGTNQDIGIVYSKHLGRKLKMAGELVYFHNSATDQIIFWQIRETSRAFNIGASDTKGVEISSSLSLQKLLFLGGNLTWQKAINRSTFYDSLYFGDDLPHRPRWDAQTTARLSAKQFTLSWETSYHSRFFAQPDNETADVFPGATLHSAALRWQPVPWFSITAESRNLTNVRGYHDRVNPLPGRSFFVSIGGEI